MSFGQALRVWCRVAALSFGGPAGQIAVMQRILVDEKRWVSQERFLHALNYCMLLPGPEAQQLATYVGWLLHKTRGGLVAGLLFVFPGFVSILTLSIVYAAFGQTPLVEGIFFGLKPAVLAIVVAALVRIGSRALSTPLDQLIALGAFIAIFFLDVAFPWIVIASGLLGWLGARRLMARGVDSGGEPAPVREASNHGSEPGALTSERPGWRRSLAVALFWGLVWWAPVLVLWVVLGGSNVLVREGLFFSKAATVTFGGAYAVLAYIAQKAVEDFGWLRPGEMLDGLGLAETTPGPLIQVVQFVGFMGAFRNPGSLDPYLAGVLGSVVTTWVTFAPCFLWIFLGAPYIEWLRGFKRLASAMSSITAAVVGVILNLAIWFALHTLFGSVSRVEWGVFSFEFPQFASVDLGAALIAAGAFVALFGLRWGMFRTLLAAVIAGLVWSFGGAALGLGA